MNEPPPKNGKPGINEALWMVIGAFLLLVVTLAVHHFYKPSGYAEELAGKTRRIELVDQIRLNLASATEAEKSAVMAITDQDSQMFADQVGQYTAAAEQERKQLEQLLTSAGNAAERKLFSQFSQYFTEFQRVDKELLDLAVKNTNLKASSLTFGPGLGQVHEIDDALSHLATNNDVSVLRPADDVRIAVWQLEATLPRHIAEESDQKMDEMEAQMAREDQTVRSSLAELASLPNLAGNPDLKTAMTVYDEFTRTKAQILKLSRENTNVRSLTLSLTQKRKVTLLCQDDLAALQQAIENEHIVGETLGGSALPR